MERIKKIADAKPSKIILREKDMTECEYKKLAKNVIEICNSESAVCILHNFANTALELNCTSLHLPLSVLYQTPEDIRKKFKILGASCHSVEDALAAQNLGCTYITAGHIYETDCKKGLPGRGIDFLKSVCKSVSIPVYAIGGINSDNIAEVQNAGAAGACIMSGVMTCENVNEYFEKIKEKINEIQ